MGKADSAVDHRILRELSLLLDALSWQALLRGAQVVRDVLRLLCHPSLLCRSLHGGGCNSAPWCRLAAPLASIRWSCCAGDPVCGFRHRLCDRSACRPLHDREGERELLSQLAPLAGRTDCAAGLQLGGLLCRGEVRIPGQEGCRARHGRQGGLSGRHSRARPGAERKHRS